MKIVSASRNEVVRLSPVSASHSKVLMMASLKAPSWAPSKLVLAIEAITTAAEPGIVAQCVEADSGSRRPSRPSRTPNDPSWENMPK